MRSKARRIEGTENENHASFMARFVLKVTPDEYELIDMTYDFVKRAFDKKYRETGARQFEHMRGTVLILVDELGITDAGLVIALLLHDCPEDTWLLTARRIRLIYGERIAGIVETLTKPKDDDPRFKTKAARHRWYYNNIKAAGVDDKIAKLCDRLQNTRALVACSREKQLRKVAETRKHLLPLIDDIARVYPWLGAMFVEKFEAALAKLA